MKKALFFPLQVGLCTLGCFYSNSTQAQVTTDGTVNTQINTNGNVAEITGGEIREGNLFHSFQDFSVPTGNEAFFNNANDISNIFSRVTGGNISNIDGTIRANGSASLFLINPAGIIFGENARLDTGGSFYGSSASSILFEDGEFSAADLENPPLLTVNAPIGLGFRDNPGDITVRGSGQGVRTNSDLPNLEDVLGVNSNSTFTLAGGNLLFEGATIKTASGRIELGSVEGGEQINLTTIDEGFSLGYTDVQSFRDIQIVEQSSVDASGEGGGDVFIQGKNITLQNGSQIDASTLGSLSGGSLNVIASDILEVNGTSNGQTSGTTSSALAIRTRTGSTGIGGDLNIQARDLRVIDGGLITSGAFGEGDGGSINVDVERLTIDRDGQITASTFSSGDAGDLTISASEVIDIADTNEERVASGLFSFVATEEAEGNGGNLLVSTSRFTLAGDVRVGVSTFGNGDGGDLLILTNQLEIRDGAEIQAIAFGNGNAGAINIEASESIQVSGTLLERGFLGGIFASAIGGGIGNGGDISISTDNLVVKEFGTISVSNFQTTGVLEPGLGDVGDIRIEANNITLDNGDITSASNANLSGGNVNLKTSEDILLRNNSLISVQAFQEAGGGSLFIDSRFVVAFPSDGTGSDLVANADAGDAGQIFLNAEQTFGLDVGNAIDSNNNFIENSTNDIDASSNEGIGGNISINIINVVDPLQGVTELPQNIDLPEQTSQQACEANREVAAKNGFTINGKGGILPDPALPLNSLNVIGNGENATTSTIPAPIETSKGKIQPARGVKITESGEVILTAYRTNNSGERIPEKRNCV